MIYLRLLSAKNSINKYLTFSSASEVKSKWYGEWERPIPILITWNKKYDLLNSIKPRFLHMLTILSFRPRPLSPHYLCGYFLYLDIMLPGLRMLDPPLSPHRHERKFFDIRVCKGHLQTSPPTPQKSYPKFWKPRITFQNIPLFLPKIT